MILSIAIDIGEIQGFCIFKAVVLVLIITGNQVIIIFTKNYHYNFFAIGIAFISVIVIALYYFFFLLKIVCLLNYNFATFLNDFAYTHYVPSHSSLVSNSMISTPMYSSSLPTSAFSSSPTLVFSPSASSCMMKDHVRPRTCHCRMRRQHCHISFRYLIPRRMSYSSLPTSTISLILLWLWIGSYKCLGMKRWGEKGGTCYYDTCGFTIKINAHCPNPCPTLSVSKKKQNML